MNTGRYPEDEDEDETEAEAEDDRDVSIHEIESDFEPDLIDEAEAESDAEPDTETDTETDTEPQIAADGGNSEDESEPEPLRGPIAKFKYEPDVVATNGDPICPLCGQLVSMVQIEGPETVVVSPCGCQIPPDAFFTPRHT